MSQSEHERLARTPSGKTLFIATIGAVVVGLLLALLTGVAGVPWLAFAIPALWFLFLIALLYLSGRAISARRRPGEAATSLLLAVLLTPIVTVAPAASFVPRLLEGLSELGDFANAEPDSAGPGVDAPTLDSPATSLPEEPSTDGATGSGDGDYSDPIDGNFESDVAVEAVTEDGVGDAQCNATAFNPANEGRDYVVTFEVIETDEFVESAIGHISLAPGETATLEAVTTTDFSDQVTCNVTSVEVYSAG